MNEFDSLGAAGPPVTLSEIELGACDRQVRAVYAFAIATYEYCGGAGNPTALQLARGTLKAVLEACQSYEAAQKRTP